MMGISKAEARFLLVCGVLSAAVTVGGAVFLAARLEESGGRGGPHRAGHRRRGVRPLCSVMALIRVRRRTGPLRLLTAAASRLARGDLDHRMPTGRVQETREMAQALNAMADSVKSIVTELSEERDKLSTILATMTDGVALLDHEGRTTLANPAAREFLGLPPGFEVGQRLIEVVRDHELSELVSRSRLTKSPQTLEFRLARQRRFFNVIATPLTLQGRESVLLVLHDETQIRRVETTRREFVANVSHELRTPLASIRASGETLQDGAMEDPEAARQFLGRIYHNAERMSALVQDLLDLSRLESGEVKLNIAPVDVVGAIAEVVETYGEQAREKGVSLTMYDASAVVEASADEGRLQQVLSNLVENAVKFTPSGGEVHVDVEHKGRWLEVRVEDRGIGVAPEDMPHVFERFYKAGRFQNQGGTGLGLAIAKHIVQSHGGRIWVSSREEGGSTFAFTIPAARS